MCSSDLLPAGFSANRDPKQAAKFASAVQDYTATSAALAYLIATAKIAEGEIQAYKFSLELPPDIDEKEVTGGDELGYAMKVDCYGTNRENLESLLEDFRDRRERYEGIKAASDANAAAAGQSHANLDVTSAGGLKAAKGKGVGSGVKGRPAQNGRSDITGTQEDAEKRKRQGP